MNPIRSRSTHALFAVAAAAVAALVISSIATGFRPADARVELARGQAILERVEHVRAEQAIREGQLRTASVTTITR